MDIFAFESRSVPEGEWLPSSAVASNARGKTLSESQIVSLWFSWFVIKKNIWKKICAYLDNLLNFKNYTKVKDGYDVDE